MSEHDAMTVKELIEKIVLPKLDSIEDKVDRQRTYMDETFVRKETQEAGHRQSERLWTRRGVVTAMFGAGSALIFEVISHIAWR